MKEKLRTPVSAATLTISVRRVMAFCGERCSSPSLLLLLLTELPSTLLPVARYLLGTRNLCELPPGGRRSPAELFSNIRPQPPIDRLGSGMLVVCAEFQSLLIGYFRAKMMQRRFVSCGCVQGVTMCRVSPGEDVGANGGRGAACMMTEQDIWQGGRRT